MAPLAPTTGTQELGDRKACNSDPAMPLAEIKQQIAEVSDSVLDVVAEDEERPHVGD